MSDAGTRTCEGCGQAVPVTDFGCPACGKFYAGSFDADPPAPAAPPVPPAMATTPLPNQPQSGHPQAPSEGPAFGPPPGPPFGYPQGPPEGPPFGSAPGPPPTPPAGGAPWPPHGAFHAPDVEGGQIWVAPPQPSSTSPLRVLVILGLVGFAAFTVLVMLVASVTLLGSKAETKFVAVGEPAPGWSAPPTTVLWDEPVDDVPMRPVQAVTAACRRAFEFDTVADEDFAPMERDGVGQVGQIVLIDNGMGGDGSGNWIGSVDLDTGAVARTDPDLDTPVVVCAWSEADDSGQEPLVCKYPTTRNDGVVIDIEQEWFQESIAIQVYELASGDPLYDTVVTTLDQTCPPTMSSERTNWSPAPTGVVEQWAAEHVEDGVFG